MLTIDRVVVMPLIPLSVPENDEIREFVVVVDDVSTPQRKGSVDMNSSTRAVGRDGPHVK